jgi:hypothetical protein
MMTIIVAYRNFASALNDRHSSLTILNVDSVMLEVNRLHSVDEECGPLLCNCH